MNRSYSENFSALDPHEQRAEELLRQFFHHHLPSPLPPLAHSDTAPSLVPYYPVIERPLFGQERPSEEAVARIAPSVESADRSLALAKTPWSRVVMLVAMMVLGLLLFATPWVVPNRKPQPRLDPREGYAHEKPPPFSMPHPLNSPQR